MSHEDLQGAPIESSGKMTKSHFSNRILKDKQKKKFLTIKQQNNLMCKKKFHKYCNCDYEPNINLDNYVFNYVNSWGKKRRRGLRKIHISKPEILDFHYHLNGKTTKADYYVMHIWYRYKGKSISRSHRIDPSELI